MLQVGVDKQGLDRFQYLLAHNRDGCSHLCRVDLLHANQITCLAVTQKMDVVKYVVVVVIGCNF